MPRGLGQPSPHPVLNNQLSARDKALTFHPAVTKWFQNVPEMACPTQSQNHQSFPSYTSPWWPKFPSWRGEAAWVYSLWTVLGAKCNRTVYWYRGPFDDGNHNSCYYQRGGRWNQNEIHPEDVHASYWAQLCCSKPFILVEKFQIYCTVLVLISMSFVTALKLEKSLGKYHCDCGDGADVWESWLAFRVLRIINWGEKSLLVNLKVSLGGQVAAL